VKDEGAYLLHAIEAIDAISSYTADVSVPLLPHPLITKET